jgi:branched-chain amino acid transport system ATP-binding protein
MGLLDLENVEVVYDSHFLALQGVSMSVEEGDIAALIGPNGAGKSSILKMISAVGQLERGEVTRGTIRFDGEDVTNSLPEAMIDRKVSHILEGSQVFEELTVEENLRCGLYRKGQYVSFNEDDYDFVFDYFPNLKERIDLKAGYISGGEQQMLVIARSILYQPRLLLVDEPSLGLAPSIVDQIFDTLEEINQKEDVTILIADQNAKELLSLANYGYVLESGQIQLHDTADELREREEIKEFFLGGSAHNSRYDLEDLQHYKIEKRWS